MTAIIEQNSRRLRRQLIERILTLVCVKLEPNAIDKLSERIKGEGYYVSTGPAALAKISKAIKGDDRP